jgi:hypothetical protein
VRGENKRRIYSNTRQYTSFSSPPLPTYNLATEASQLELNQQPPELQQPETSHFIGIFHFIFTSTISIKNSGKETDNTQKKSCATKTQP